MTRNNRERSNPRRASASSAPRARSRSGDTPRSSASRRKVSTTGKVVPLRGSGHIRWSKVMTAQARIAVGYYDRVDVKERVLEAVLHELSRH